MVPMQVHDSKTHNHMNAMARPRAHMDTYTNTYARTHTCTHTHICLHACTRKDTRSHAQAHAQPTESHAHTLTKGISIPVTIVCPSCGGSGRTQV